MSSSGKFWKEIAGYKNRAKSSPFRVFVDGNWEVRRGPYGDWLVDAAERMGQDLWEQVCERTAPEADAILRRHGVVGYAHSIHKIRHDRSVLAAGLPLIEADPSSIKERATPDEDRTSRRSADW